jgi:hypothetical protein
LISFPQIVYLFIDMAKRLLQVHHAAAAELEEAEMASKAAAAAQAEISAEKSTK